MKCETCIKREATVAYTHIVDDEKKTLFLCQVCADEKNIEVSPASEPKPKEIPILVKKVKEELTNLAGAEDAEGGIEDAEAEEIEAERKDDAPEEQVGDAQGGVEDVEAEMG